MGLLDDAKDRIEKAKDNISDNADNIEDQMHEKKGEAQGHWDASQDDKYL